MSMYSHVHLADDAVTREYNAHVVRHHAETALLLSWLAEFDERHLFEPAGYPSMLQYCVEHSHMSQPVAYNFIRVARTARRFPAIFPALAQGRLHMCGVLLLAPRLTPETADDLLAAAAGKPKAQIERMLAERSAPLEVPVLLTQPGPVAAMDELTLTQLAPGRVGATECAATMMMTAPPALRGHITPLSHGHSELIATLDTEGTQALDDIRALLGHSLPCGSIPIVIKRALLSLARELRRKKFAQVDRPRAAKPGGKGRGIPAQVRRTVHERDQGACTFVSAEGHHCASRERLEYDHIVPVARGGESTSENIRLRCRTHNQYEAKRMFGAGFMQEKREQSKARRADRVPAPRPTRAPALPEPQAEVIPWLLKLGFNKHEAHRGALLCAAIPTAPLGERVRVALRGLAPSSARRVPFEPRALAPGLPHAAQ